MCRVCGYIKQLDPFYNVPIWRKTRLLLHLLLALLVLVVVVWFKRDLVQSSAFTFMEK